MCPVCMVDLQNAQALEAHYLNEHAAEDASTATDNVTLTQVRFVCCVTFVFKNPMFVLVYLYYVINDYYENERTFLLHCF